MKNILESKLFGLLKFFIFAFSAPPFSVGETLHAAYKKYKIKRFFFFFFCTRENSDVFNTLDEMYLVITSKE